MTDSKFRENLGSKFQALPDNRWALSGTWAINLEQDPPSGRMWMVIGPETTAERFEALARQGGDALSENDFVDSLAVWMETLRSEGFEHGTGTFRTRFGIEDPNSLQQIAGVINNIGVASETLCARLQNRAFEAERIARAVSAQSSVQVPMSQAKPIQIDGNELPRLDLMPVNRQLEMLRIEADMTQMALSESVELDLRTVQRHLSGATCPAVRLISRYEKQFSMKLKRQVVIGKLP